MNPIPAPSLRGHQEEWPDADFDLPEGQPITVVTDKDIDDDEGEDWDIDMDLGPTGGAKALPSSPVPFSMSSAGQMFTIRPPLSLTSIDDDDDDEGVSTIKVAILPKPPQLPKLPPSPIDEDFEDAFALPSDLTQLSLAPLSLNHRSSKTSLEWGDKDQTSSSQSSDAYSSLGFADASPSSNSASSVSLPCTESEDDDDDDEDELDGLVIPSGLFESGKGARHLTKLLEMKKKAEITNTRIKVASPDPEDDFEIGLVIDDDVDLSPSRLLYSHHQQQSQRLFNRSNSLPVPRQHSSALRPPSRLKSDRAKSPSNPPPSSSRQFQKLRLSPSPPLRPPPRSQTFQALSPPPLSFQPPTAAAPSSFLSPKPGSLRGQKSHSGLKPPTPPSTARITRKASLSSLLETGSNQASGSGSVSSGTSKAARYEEPTAASRAKSFKSREFRVPPARPTTPSANSAALRLTMPTATRMKSRPALSSIFSAGPTTPGAHSPLFRESSPIPPRPLSNMSTRIPRPTISQPVAPKVLRRPKRQRTFGDGTELDGIEDLPTDRDKESQFHVQPKGYGNRVPGGSYPSKSGEKGTLRRKGRRDGSGASIGPFVYEL